MPRGDRTGPEGAGPRTGRAAGLCAGNDSPGYMNQAETLRGGGFGGRMGLANRRGRGAFRGAGFQGGGGRGLGMRLRGRYYDGPYAGGSVQNAASEIDILRNDAERLEAELAAVKKRLKSLESE